jgi:hypothetical protein
MNEDIFPLTGGIAEETRGAPVGTWSTFLTELMNEDIFRLTGGIAEETRGVLVGTWSTFLT